MQCTEECIKEILQKIYKSQKLHRTKAAAQQRCSAPKIQHNKDSAHHRCIASFMQLTKDSLHQRCIPPKMHWSMNASHQRCSSPNERQERQYTMGFCLSVTSLCNHQTNVLGCSRTRSRVWERSSTLHFMGFGGGKIPPLRFQ